MEARGRQREHGQPNCTRQGRGPRADRRGGREGQGKGGGGRGGAARNDPRKTVKARKGVPVHILSLSLH